MTYNNRDSNEFFWSFKVELQKIENIHYSKSKLNKLLKYLDLIIPHQQFSLYFQTFENYFGNLQLTCSKGFVEFIQFDA